MKTRATITIDPLVLSEAKSLARHRHTSVSSLIETLLRQETHQQRDSVSNLIGSASLRDPHPEDDRQKTLTKKYIHA